MLVKPVTVSVLVKAEWDEEASVWVATSDDVPGLVAEHADFRKLQTIVTDLVPILLIENDMLRITDEPYELPVHIAAQALSSSKAYVNA